MTGQGQKAGRWGFSPFAALGRLSRLLSLYSVLGLEMFRFPLIDRLQAAKLSSVLLLARSSFLHFLYKESRRRGGGKRGRWRTVLRQHYLKGAQCAARK